MPNQDFNGQILAIAVEWDKAEKVMKAAERVRAEVVQPSVNELRYAGRRLVDAIRTRSADTNESQEFEVFVSEALQFCKRAQHDAIDATILFVQQALNEYESEFSLPLLIQYFPGVADLRAKLQEADALIIRSREDRMARHADYETLANGHLVVIIDEFKKIQSNRSALEQLAGAAKLREETQAEKTKQETRRFRLNIWIAAILALTGAALGAILGAALQVAWSGRPAPTVANSPSIEPTLDAPAPQP